MSVEFAADRQLSGLGGIHNGFAVPAECQPERFTGSDDRHGGVQRVDGPFHVRRSDGQIVIINFAGTSFAQIQGYPCFFRILRDFQMIYLDPGPVCCAAKPVRIRSSANPFPVFVGELHRESASATVAAFHIFTADHDAEIVNSSRLQPQGLAG